LQSAVLVAAVVCHGAVADQAQDNDIIALRAELDRSRNKADEATKRADKLEEELRNSKSDSKGQHPISAAVHWLQTPSPELQLGIAGVALVFGLGSIGRPIRFVQGSACCLAALAAFMDVSHMASVVWAGEFQEIVAPIAGLEAAFIVAMAAGVGFEGFQLIVGALLGLGVAQATMKYAPVDSDIPVSFVWTSCFGLAGFLLLMVGRNTVCGLLGPIIGGLLVGNSAGYFLTFFLTEGGEMPPCLEFPICLISGDKCGRLLGQEMQAMRVLAIAAWIIVALLGIRVYVNGSLCGSAIEEEEQATVIGRPQKRVRIDLPPARQPLLEEGVNPREVMYHNPRGPKRGFTMPQMPMGFMKGTSSSELQSAVPRMPKVPKKLGGRRSSGDPYDFYG